MKSIYRHPTGCNTASLMLAVWLFLLGSSFANACLLKVPDHRGYSEVHSQGGGRDNSEDKAACKG